MTTSTSTSNNIAYASSAMLLLLLLRRHRGRNRPCMGRCLRCLWYGTPTHILLLDIGSHGADVSLLSEDWLLSLSRGTTFR